MKTRLNSERTRKNETTIHVISRSSGKPAIARVADVMANDPKWQQQRIDIRDLNAIFEGLSQVILTRRIYLVFLGDCGLPSPDFMIIHDIFPNLRRRKQPLELYGFPPWQTILTEF